MKYIYFILLILVALSVAAALVLNSSRIPPENIALVVNDRSITAEEFNKLRNSRPSESRNGPDFINSLITKELLIQESRKEGIDKEEAFRTSIQSFYEQSLIKLLMDRKYASLSAPVSEEDVKRYLSLSGRKLRITTLTFANIQDARDWEHAKGEVREVYFEDLSDDLKESISGLREGEATKPLANGDKCVVVRMDKIEGGPRPVFNSPERESIRKMLEKRKKERLMNEWISELRNRASVKVMLKGEN